MQEVSIINEFGIYDAMKRKQPEQTEQKKGAVNMNEMAKTPGTLESREVAAMVEKDHKNLLRDIETYIKYMEESNELKLEPVDFFIESTYQDAKGEPRKCYLITKQGCEFIANKLTGAKGAQFTAAYVTKFNAMEQRERQAALPPADDLKARRIAVTEMNARTRQAVEMRKLAEMSGIPDTYKQVLAAKAAEVMTGQPLLPLPKSERQTYSAAEIGAKFGISAHKVGALANDNGLKTSEYGVLVWDKSPHSAKEVQTWRYYDTVIPALAKLLGVEVA
jgi:Rha family phage regulatory protein